MTTFAQLKTSVDSWLARDDVAVTGTDMPQIMLNAESQISRFYRFVQQEANATLNLTSRRGDLPADFLELRNPFIDDNIRKFEYKTPQAIREAPSWDSGRNTAFFTIEGGGGTSPDDRAQIVVNTNPTVADPVDVEILMLRQDFPMMFLLTVMLFFMAYGITGPGRISRRSGFLLLSLFIGYQILVWITATPVPAEGIN